MLSGFIFIFYVVLFLNFLAHLCFFIKFSSSFLVGIFIAHFLVIFTAETVLVKLGLFSKGIFVNNPKINPTTKASPVSVVSTTSTSYEGAIRCKTLL